MYTCIPAHHIVHGRKTLQMHGFPVYAKETAVTLAIRCEFFQVKYLVLTPAFCELVQKLCPQVPQTTHESDLNAWFSSEPTHEAEKKQLSI